MSGPHGLGPGPALLPQPADLVSAPQDQGGGTAPARGAASDELAGAVILTEPAGILEAMLSSWPDRATVFDLVGYLHQRELLQVQQGVVIKFAYTPPQGLPVMEPS